MLLKLDDSRLLTEAVGIMNEIVTEVRCKVTKQGLSIIAVDPANVALVSLKMPASLFSQFQLDQDELLGLNLEDLKQVLRRAGPSSSLVIENKNNTLKLNIQNTVKRSFNLALLNLEAEEKRIPELDFTSKIELNSSVLAQAIEDAAIVADACSFITTKDSFVIEAKGTINSSRTELSSDEAKISAGDAKAKYSLEYLGKFIKSAKLTEKALVQFGNDFPARFDFRSGTFELVFILAPRVEEE